MAETDENVTPEPDQPSADRAPSDFPIVGIGASAGGIAAFEAFFSTMPVDSDPGMAFVLVQHLSRDHKSILSDLVRRYTKMEVFDVEEGMVVKPNCAYIIPPNRDMALSDGALHLLEPSLARGIRLPIDFFFRSLAQEKHDRAICVILSGTGSDGTLGARAVKGEGGMVMAQSPESTEYDGMPGSAIATGIVDFILPPKGMPAQLLAYVGRAYGTPILPVTPESPQPADGLDKIFALVRSQTGHDFSKYKRSTIVRRVERRMAVHQIDHLADYIRYLQLTRPEIDALFRDFLIGVTNFFRDPEIFETLQEQVVPKLFESKSANQSIRIWVPGCSTGEEAYSIAILLRERMEVMKEVFKVQIFATDIDRQALDYARAGVYPASIIADISPERLAHFFEQERPDGSTYRIHKTIRDMLIFSEHDLIKDPPFSKLDLLSCRNLLIYMGPDLQKKLMPLFHYALMPDGFLLLGSSESIGDSGDLFVNLDRRGKIFQCKPDVKGRQLLAVSTSSPRLPATDAVRQSTRGGLADGKVSLHEIAVRTVMGHFAPVGALVNERGDILYLLGRTGAYLEPSPGEASMNIFRMAREGLRSDLTVALHRAVSNGITTVHPGLHIKNNGFVATTKLTVVPIVADSEGTIPPGLFLVILESEAAAPKRSSVVANAAADGAMASASLDLNDYIIRLKQELRGKDEHLQTIIEELESSNEELRSAHEEMQSVNEEMQSTNEELETSKEELQSVNEELSTVNSELHAKVLDLSRSNNDMKNLLSGTDIGTIFVDHQLRILRFTPTVSSLINLIETDVGRPVDQIRSTLRGYDHLAADSKEVLSSLVPKELEVESNAGAWYLLRIRPYRTLENVIEGVVITFTDCTALKNAQSALQESETLRRLAVVVRDSRDAVLVQGLTGRIIAWNPGAEAMYGWTEVEALTKNIRDLMPEADRESAITAIREQCEVGLLAPKSQKRIAKDGRTVQVSIISSALVDNTGETYAIATTERLLAN